MSIFIRTIPNVMRQYGCTAADAQRFIDLREEGYGTHQAALLAGLSDPPDPDTGGSPAADPPGCEGCNCAACELRRKHEAAAGVNAPDGGQKNG